MGIDRALSASPYAHSIIREISVALVMRDSVRDLEDVLLSKFEGACYGGDEKVNWPETSGTQPYL